jgi:hypothetical protein
MYYAMLEDVHKKIEIVFSTLKVFTNSLRLQHELPQSAGRMDLVWPPVCVCVKRELPSESPAIL